MKRIFKYKLRVTDTQKISMPVGAEILTVGVQEDFICIWALVNDDHAIEERTFEIFGTGNPIHGDMGISRNYLGTVFMHDGKLVWHIFEYTGI